MEQGPQDRKKIRQYLLNRQELPESLKDLPELQMGLETYLADYLTLASFSGGECIKLSEVYAYAENVGMGEEYLNDFLDFIPPLDIERMKYLRKKAKTEATE